MADYRYYPLPPPPAPTTLAERTQMSWRWMTTGLRRASYDWADAETVADRVFAAWDAVAAVLDAALDIVEDVADTTLHTPRLLAWSGGRPARPDGGA